MPRPADAQVLELFREVCLLPRAQRTAFLAAACGTDADLRGQVAALLAWDDSDEAVAGNGNADPAADLLAMHQPDPAMATLPASIGGHRVVRRIAAGGMGAVYEAWQEHPARRVAIKVAHVGGALTSERVRRFHLEAQLLARLHHPGIARIIASGTTAPEAGGRPFLVMEYVAGRSLTDHARGLPGTPERLALLVEVCKAVAYAHQHGVIHRDLKPDNILVEPDGTPRVLDFGVARVQEAAGFGVATLRTEAGRIFGTIGYMAPEQLAGVTDGLGPAADVYSLGVMLYELLTGRLPHELDGASITRALDIVRNTDAPPLSVVRPEFRGDIEALAGRALEKDPRHRYPDAAALRQDLERHLRGEPILARPAGPVRRLAKWGRRSPALATAVVGLFVALAAIATVLLVKNQAIRAALAANQRMLDARRLRLATADADALWPARPARIQPIIRWLDEHRALLARLPAYRAELAQLRATAAIASADAWTFTDPDRQSRHDELAGLVHGLDALAADPLLDQMAARLELARSIVPITVTERRADWDATITRIQAQPAYGGLRIEPQAGLLPLGPDPASGLEEFLHYETHAGPLPAPGQGARQALGLDANSPRPETGLVFVLIPGGTFRMGAQRRDPDGDNHDPAATPFEKLVLGEVQIAPFFLSKYELTAAQWQRLTGDNPSAAAGPVRPVTNVSWTACDQVLRRLALALPTEPQWEYAARGGAMTNRPIWWTGDDVVSLQGMENVFDLTVDRHRPMWRRTSGEEPAPFTDAMKAERLAAGDPGPAVVGSYGANPFGLYDMGGNVTEWCADAPAGPGSRACRGGNFRRSPVWARATARIVQPVATEFEELGLRPARAIESSGR